MKLFEAVPNFSEGRDPAKVEAIVRAGRSVDGVTLLDVESDAAHNRSVVSIAGSAEAVSESLFRMIRVAVETIDLNHHSGEHPRMGAADVVPFVPFGEATIEEASELAERLGRRVWTELGLPVYLYASSAKRPERSDLAHVRRGGFEGIRDAIGTDPERAPDIGETRVHPTAGIVAIGARPVLIAYNANLATADLAVAKSIAHAVRERDGGLPAVKALGFEAGTPPRAQVSMNLTDPKRTPVHVALDAVRAEAAKRGTTVESSEIVGLVPEDSLLAAAEHYLALTGFDRGRILERRLATALAPSGTERTSDLAHAPLHEFVARVAARTPTPGGGSVAAAAAAMGAALAEMAIRFSIPANGRDPEFEEALGELGRDRARLLELIDADTASYEAVRAARRERKKGPDDATLRQAFRMALRTATETPLETARLARRSSDLARRVKGRIKPAIVSDLTTGIALLDAALAGAAANVEVNLKDLSAEGIDVHGLSGELKELLGEAR